MLFEIIGDALLVGCGLALTVAFGQMAVLGIFTAAEPNSIILKLELGMALFIFLYGLERFIDDCIHR